MKSASNPFTLSFGKKPVEYISRIKQSAEIIEQFQAEIPANQVFMITGVRGSGKTVMMSQIASELSQDEKWITVELTTTMDMLKSLAAKLYNSQMRFHFERAKIDLSFFGIGISVEGAAKITDMETAIEQMLAVIQKQGRRLLITVDEAVNNEYVRVFASVFQIFVRRDFPVFLLMTGLYDNIYNLQNENNLTFLYRAPKLFLEPLNAGAIIASYQKTFDTSYEKARQMAQFTGGYPFAFQVLGYLCWENGGADALMRILPVFDQYLDEYVYSKIWSELSGIDRNIVKLMAETGETSVTNIREQLNMKPQEFSVYRRRLLNKGVILAPFRGEIKLALPRFDIFVEAQFA